MGNYVYLGLPRNGSQAILQWIRSQIPDVKYYEGRLMGSDELSEGNNLIRFESLYFSDYVEKNIDAKTIAVLRNPWNVIASHNKWNRGGVLYKRKNEAIKIWNDYYNKYLNNDLDILFIIYDKWFSDKEYRKNIINKLGLEFSDEGFETVPKAGGGSSFDGVEYNGNAQQMDVLSRYKQVSNYSMNLFKESDAGLDLKNKWNHICDLEEIKELKII